MMISIKQTIINARFYPIEWEHPRTIFLYKGWNRLDIWNDGSITILSYSTDLFLEDSQALHEDHEDEDIWVCD